MNSFELTQGAAGRPFIKLLFGAILLLQVLDMHSTLIALHKRAETNQLILQIATAVGLPFAVVVVKLLATVSISLLIRVWSRSRGMDAPVAVALVVMCLAYGTTVIHNYVG
jgi:DNA-binding LytR/AlgR family response regulator